MLLYIHNCFVLSWHAGLLPADDGDALSWCLFVCSWQLFKIVWWKYPQQRGLQGTSIPKRFGTMTPADSTITSADSTTLFGHAHRDKSTKHTTPNSLLGRSRRRNGKNHCPNCQNLELAYLLNSLGETPNCFLKLVEKWERVLKPVISAISEMLYLCSLSSCAARLSLYLLKNTLGFSPVRPFTL